MNVVATNGGSVRTLPEPGAVLLPLVGDLWRLVACVVVLLIGSLAFELGRAAVHRARQRRLHTDARLVTVLAPPRVAEDGAAALWGNLAGLLRPRWRRLLTGQPHLSFEYHLTAHASTIQIWVPGPIPPGLVERAVAAAWPGATTRTTPAGPPATGPTGRTLHRAVVTGGTLRLARATGLSLADHAPGDPVTALLAAADDLTTPPTTATGHRPGATVYGPTDEIVVQVLARPVPTRSARARNSYGGVGVGGVGGVSGMVVDAAGGTLAWLVRECLATFVPGAVPHAAPRARSAAGTIAAGGDRRARLEGFSEDRAAVAKARQATFETLVRYAATTHLLPDPDPVRARAQLAHARRVVRGRAHAVAAVFASFTGHNHYRRHHQPWPTHAVNSRRLSRGDLLSITELAAIATLPTGHAPGLARAGARAVAPPPGIPTPGPDAKPLGDTTTATGSTATTGRPVGVRVADARHHWHVIGATGSGKSTLLAGLILDDIRRRRGVVVIDPKGDLITDLTARLPAAVLARAVLIDPDRGGPPPNLNPLATSAVGSSAAARALAVENLVAICRRVFAAYWGPRTDDLMRAACLTLAVQPGPRSLADLPTLLTHPDVRARALRAVTDPVLRGFWTGYAQLSEPARAATIAPLMNKVRALLLRPYPRALLTGLPPAVSSVNAAAHRALSPPVDLGRVLDGGILLARIPKGSLGDEATRLVGSIIVAHTWTAATARARLPQDRRRDAALVIDECHNFLNLPHSIDDLLAEARGLRLSVVLAHQNLAQLPRDLRAGIAANARNKIFFTVAPDDARDLARHTTPHLDEHDLAHLDAFHAATRLVDRGADTPAFTLRTRPLPPPPGP